MLGQSRHRSFGVLSLCFETLRGNVRRHRRQRFGWFQRRWWIGSRRGAEPAVRSRGGSVRDDLCSRYYEQSHPIADAAGTYDHRSAVLGFRFGGHQLPGGYFFSVWRYWCLLVVGERFADPYGTDWMIVTSVVHDPTYLAVDYIVSTNFKREPDDSKWRPKPCSVQ